MEIEAWFLAEHSHFQRIDPGLTLEIINTYLSFDVSSDDVAQRVWPSNDLDNIYMMVGRNYQKGSENFTVPALDYANIYIELRNRVSQLQILIDLLDGFLS